MNNYFCVLPFFGYEFSPRGGTHCCLLPKNYDIEAIKQSMSAKERSTFCNACWKLEDAGLISDRKLKNSALDFYWDRDINFIEQDAVAGNTKVIMAKIFTSNTCNSTCVTCNSGPSTAWAPLERKMGILPRPSSRMSEDKISKLDFENLVSLNFVGGEPLYEKQNFYILDQLVQHGNTNCFIQITTNGSIALSPENESLLRKFKNINFNISIDGTGKVFEYMRYPLKWDDVLLQLKLFRGITDKVSVSYTTSNLNVMYHHDTTDWFTKQGLQYHYNPVISPSHFRPSALPAHAKEKILLSANNQSKDFDFFLGQAHSDQDDIDFNTMMEVVAKQDYVKGISFKDYLPEFAKLIS